MERRFTMTKRDAKKAARLRHHLARANELVSDLFAAPLAEQRGSDPAITKRRGKAKLNLPLGVVTVSEIEGEQ
jgi:hypothetical protein